MLSLKLNVFTNIECHCEDKTAVNYFFLCTVCITPVLGIEHLLGINNIALTSPKFVDIYLYTVNHSAFTKLRCMWLFIIYCSFLRVDIKYIVSTKCLRKNVWENVLLIVVTNVL